jgi:hypothetical protein
MPPPDVDYAQTAFVPPRTVENGKASFALRSFEAGAWASAAEGRWLFDTTGKQVPGSDAVPVPERLR